jgi:glycosyltransferase involved in cell wall biosynthesis
MSFTERPVIPLLGTERCRSKLTQILVSAYVCDPGAGSEPGKTWEWSRILADEGSHVTILTKRSQLRPKLLAAVRDEPRVQLLVIDIPAIWSLIRKAPGGNYIYYMRWQREVRAYVKDLEPRTFDAVVHLAFGADWLPAGILSSPSTKRIWGPVGGSGALYPNLFRYAGWKGSLAWLTRNWAGALLRRTVGRRAAKESTLILAQNEDVAQSLRAYGARVRVFPSVMLDTPPLRAQAATTDEALSPTPVAERRLVFAGRLLSWKGGVLAIEALAQLPAGFHLDVFGEGPDRTRMMRAARRARVADRVHFHGRRPRQAVLASMLDAHALLFPSFHESAGWIVAEAVSVGCPVVCLDVGGPPELSRGRGIAVDPRSRVVSRDLAEAIESVTRGTPDDRWSVSMRAPAVRAIILGESE